MSEVRGSGLECQAEGKAERSHPAPKARGGGREEPAQSKTLFSGAPKSLQMVTAAMKLKDAYFLKESYDQPRQHIEKQRHYFANKGPSSQGYGFSSVHVWQLELDCEES